MLPLISDLAYWINERYNIKLRREAGLPKPWSPDRIFQSVRFCNVHREDDVVTKWIRENWNRADHAPWVFVLARMLNYVPTLESITEFSELIEEGEWPLDGLRDGLRSNRAMGEKIFTSVYTISTCGKAMDKLDYVFDWVLTRVQALSQMRHDSCRETWQDLQNVDGLGSFLAAQVVADMKNTPGHPLAKAPDFWSFSAPGPGSLRGLSWYFHGGPTGVTASRYQDNLVRCMDDVMLMIHPDIPRISNQDFQNCLCEFSKYMKVKNDPHAHVRNHYPGV